MKVKKLITALCTVVAFVTIAANIEILDTYDQLQNHIGSPNLLFVRDAASSKTGQHGDPLVPYGSAWYIWDSLERKFKIAGSEATVKETANNMSTNYITKSLYTADSNVIKGKMTRFESTVSSNTVVVLRLEQRIRDIETAVDVDTVINLRNQVELYRAGLVDITNIVIHANSDFRELKAAVVDILKAADKALGGEGVHPLVTDD